MVGNFAESWKENSVISVGLANMLDSLVGDSTFEQLSLDVDTRYYVDCCRAGKGNKILGSSSFIPRIRFRMNIAHRFFCTKRHR